MWSAPSETTARAITGSRSSTTEAVAERSVTAATAATRLSAAKMPIATFGRRTPTAPAMMAIRATVTTTPVISTGLSLRAEGLDRELLELARSRVDRSVADGQERGGDPAQQGSDRLGHGDAGRRSKEAGETAGQPSSDPRHTYQFGAPACPGWVQLPARLSDRFV